jgi:hypothetical protein
MSNKLIIAHIFRKTKINRFNKLISQFSQLKSKYLKILIDSSKTYKH